MHFVWVMDDVTVSCLSATLTQEESEMLPEAPWSRVYGDLWLKPQMPETL